jgi:hypothetical protein
MEDILSGLCEENIPLVFAIIGDTDEIEVFGWKFCGYGRKTIHHLKLIKPPYRVLFRELKLLSF